MKNIATLLSILSLAACTTAPQAAPPASSAPANNNLLPKFSEAQKLEIGKKIWQNESGGTIAGLTHWNEGEEFPSMGIGHYIWYPKGFNGRWTETFPLFINYAKSRRAPGIPAWVLTANDCPWNSRASFDAAKNGPQLTQLRNWLANTVALQTDFILQRSTAALPKILAAAPAADRARIRQNYAKVASTTNGAYALIDYPNFKGDGTNVTERYNGQGWGTLQVLQNMRPSAGGQDSARAFADAAKAMLERRIKNSPQARGESRWREGWNNRCNTYARPL